MRLYCFFRNAGLALALGYGVLAQAEPAPAPVQTPSFTIERFNVLGNKLILPADIDVALQGFTGAERTFADVQRAVEALENLYRRSGYTTAYVAVPEQELNKGVVHLRVVEGRIAKVLVEGNQVFSEENIRASLPALRENESPMAMRLSENIQLANENGSKQLEVVLAAGEAEGEINARIKVKDEKPWRVFSTFDNTGSEATGQHRLGVGFQHDNLFDADQTLSLAYAMSPDKPESTKVDVYSLGYRIPLYRLGDSIDFLYANSTVDVPSTSPSLAGALGIVGRGNIYSLRYNWLMPRQGEYASRVIFSLDERNMESSCKSAGQQLVGVAGCEPYRVRPLTASYAGRWERPSQIASFGIGLSRNIAASSNDSYYLASGGRDAPNYFTVARANFGLAQALPADWQIRVAGQGQWSKDALVPTEQLGIAGSLAVRGFTERAVALDTGYFVQSELYTPDLAALTSAPGSFRALAFYDAGAGRNVGVPSALQSNSAISSAGLGLRYVYAKSFNWRLDLAHIIDSQANTSNGDPIDTGWRGHFSLTVGF
jgi:hemolysin activation/secretion protein